MKVKRFITGSLLSGILLCGCCTWAADSPVTPPMIGQWKGNGRIIVSWSRQPNISLNVNIGADGRVAGTVGDATLIDGRLNRNRGPLGRKLNLATDYIIKGDLEGPILAGEGVNRKSVSIPVNFTGDQFVGGLHTSGSKFGGKEKMILSASSLVLEKLE